MADPVESRIDQTAVRQNPSQWRTRGFKRYALIRGNTRNNPAARINNVAVRSDPAQNDPFCAHRRRIRHHRTDRAAFTVDNAAFGHQSPRRFVFLRYRQLIGIHTSQKFVPSAENFACFINHRGNAAVHGNNGRRIENMADGNRVVVQNVAARRHAPDPFAPRVDDIAFDIGVSEHGTSRSGRHASPRQSSRDNAVFGQEGSVGQNAPLDFSGNGTVGHDAPHQSASGADDGSFGNDGRHDFIIVVYNRSVGSQNAERIAFERNGLAVGVDFAGDAAVPVDQSPVFGETADRIAGHIQNRHRRRQTADSAVGRHHRTVRTDPADQLSSRSDRQTGFDHPTDNDFVPVRDITVR